MDRDDEESRQGDHHTARTGAVCQTSGNQKLIHELRTKIDWRGQRFLQRKIKKSNAGQASLVADSPKGRKKNTKSFVGTWFGKTIAGS